MRLTFNPFTPKYPSIMRQLETAKTQLEEYADNNTFLRDAALADAKLHEEEAVKANKVVGNLAKLFD